MKLGLTVFLTDQSIGPADVARAAEERGFTSVWLPEHTHIPSSRATPSPMGGELPEQYRRTLDPYVALAAMASVTTHLRLGTGISLVAQRDPIVLAKEVATLDHISDGRMSFGVGFGWNREELEDHGVPFARRRDAVRERVLAIQALWCDEEASFDGEFARFGPSWAWPKPVQQPRVPTFVGGAPGDKLFAAVAEYADGWIPIGGRGVKEALPKMHAAAEAAGRDPSELRVVPFGTIPDPGKLDYYESLGIEEVVLMVPTGPADRVLPVLDDYAKFV